MLEALVVESLAISVADMTSAADGAGVTAASGADKDGYSVPPAVEGEGADLCTYGPLPVSGPQAAAVEGARSEDDQHWCLYVGTP
jgi:hypothetical protein